MFPHQEHIWFIGCVFNTLYPTCTLSMLWSCIAHNHLLHTYLLPMSCIGLYLIFSSQHVMFTLCFVSFCFVLGLSFIFSFILHHSCIIIIIRTFISCPRFSLTLCLFVTKRGRVYQRVLSFRYDFCAYPQGEKFYLMHIRKGRDYHRGDAYTKGEKTLIIRKICFVCFFFTYLCFVAQYFQLMFCIFFSTSLLCPYWILYP